MSSMGVEALNLSDQQTIINEWLIKYLFFKNKKYPIFTK